MKLFVINGERNPHLHDPTWHWLTLNQWLVGPRSNNCSQVFVFSLTCKTNLKSGRRQTLCNNSSSHCVYLTLIGCLKSERVGLFLLQFTTLLRFICVKYSFTLTAEWRGCCLLLDLKEWMVSVLVAEMHILQCCFVLCSSDQLWRTSCVCEANLRRQRELCWLHGGNYLQRGEHH